MDAAALALFVTAAVVAAADWAAVAVDRQRVEFVAKPAALALLIGAAALADLGASQPWVVAALVLGLAGDIALLAAADDEPDVAFLAGLGAFLAGHVCYVVALVRAGVGGTAVVVGVVIVAAVAAVSLPAVLRGAAAKAGSGFAGVVLLYATALAVMAVLAVGTGLPLVGVGGVAFLVSDSLLARERFASAVPHGPVLVIVTYHVAQFLIVAGLAWTV